MMIERSSGICVGVFVSLFVVSAAVQAQRIASIPPVGAEAAVVLTKPVTVDLNNVPLEVAITRLAATAGVRVTYRVDQVHPITAPVSLHVREIPLGEAFARVLRGTGLSVEPVTAGDVNIRASGGPAVSVAQGGVTGKVIDAKTRRGLRGAIITLGSINKETASSDDGSFRIVDVAPGAYRVHVRMLGYVKTVKPVTVVDGQTTSIEVALEPSVNALDQVVVTGTVLETARREIPNAMTVITAQDIEQRGITKIDQLFHGDVPGLFALEQGAASPVDQVTMFARGATGLHDSNGATKSQGVVKGTNPIKTYVDGVEVADPQFLNQIDPKSIERIEILSGPQASTIYGSNAINGVMQIFTKRGTTQRPQLTLALMTGFVENNYRSALTPNHDNSAQVTGTEGHISYNVGGTHYHMGAWTPAKQTTRLGGFGGTRLQNGPITADASVRLATTRNVHRATPGQGVLAYREDGFYTNVAQGLGEQPRRMRLNGQTLGFTLGYAPFPWLTNELVLGTDKSEYQINYSGAAHLTPSDSLLFLNNTQNTRNSTRGRVSVRAPFTDDIVGTLSMGIDAWRSNVLVLSVWPATYTGSLTGTTNVTRRADRNTGGFLQSQLGLFDQLFLTYGLRVEWNPSFGGNANPNLAPRYGLAYTHEFGVVTTKLRGSWGRATRPPLSENKVAQTAKDRNVDASVIRDFGNFDFYIANPDLGPEHQSGAEGGIEMYVGNVGSLVVTRYNQTVDRLILQIQGVDSVLSLVPTSSGHSAAADGYRWYYQYQHINAASIRNQGWELQGSINTGPFTTRGTYSWTKSRVLGVTEEYRRLVTNQPTYARGASLQYLPEHTWAGSVTYARGATRLMLSLNGTGMLRSANTTFYNENVSTSIRLMSNRVTMQSFPWVYLNSGYVVAHVNASRQITPSLEGVLQIQNIADRYNNDVTASTAVLGRQTKFGVRYRL